LALPVTQDVFLLSFERLVGVSLVDAFGLPLLGAAFKATSFGGGGLLIIFLNIKNKNI